MIVVFKPGAPENEKAKIKNMLIKANFQINEIVGQNLTIYGVIGDTSSYDPRTISVNAWVDKVMRVQEPYKRANRLFHPDNSIIDVSGVKVGGKKLAVIAGPCSIETTEQMNTVAQAVKKAGATMLRGGAFKPRTSPYSFQGLKEKGLDMLAAAGKENHLPIVTEIMSADKIEKFVPPRKGRSHVLRIIREVLSFEPEGKTTNIKGALEYFNNAIKKRSIVFLLSDFMDSGYEKILRIIGRKHDLVGIVINDERENMLPGIGLVKFVDAETGEERWLDTSNKLVRKKLADYRTDIMAKRKSLFLASRLDSIEISTGQSYIPPLVQFFRLRERRW